MALPVLAILLLGQSGSRPDRRGARNAALVSLDLAHAARQLAGDGASLAADRSEFVMSALLPVAASIADARSELLAAEP